MYFGELDDGDYGVLSGISHIIDCTCLKITVTFQKREHLQYTNFEPVNSIRVFAYAYFQRGDTELRLREGLRSKIATSNEYKKGTQAGDLLSNVR